MKINDCCSIDIHEFSQINGYYWEISVPTEIHPRERIKEFTLEDPGLGWPVRLNTIASIHPSKQQGIHTYRGVIDHITAEAVKSMLILLL